MTKHIFIAALSALALSACTTASTTPVQTAPAVTTLSELNGTHWTVISINGEAVPDAGRAAQMHFADGRVSASLGCNQMMGSATMTDGKFSAGQMAMTMMACPSDIMEREARFGGMLAKPLTITRPSATQLLLTAPDGGQIQLARTE